MRNNALSLACLFLFAVTADVGESVELPEFIHVCKRSDANVEACVTESVEYLKPYLQKGVAEYNIPSLEPLLLKELVAAEGAGIRITAKDVQAFGASDFTISKLKVDLNQLLFNIDVSLPHLHIQGMYEIDGKVLLLPIHGSGHMTGNFTECTGSVKVHAIRDKQPSGDDYVSIDEFKMKISVGRGTLHLDNLFGGEKVLGDVINSAINSNFNAFLRELQPLIEQALSDAFREIANSIVNQFTYDQLFPAN
ncbi:hypothetical protein KPH14_005264 [Odynerus spinipes]|uniref:Circadian clock-controlled protein n=1 Tax=Odynerus spinipes TaxID=1348599 RepID=A0AAD9RBJ0_9HYME|nr:hypothetical protein KPH14_005264 [Odynerus spinipes]